VNEKNKHILEEYQKYLRREYPRTETKVGHTQYNYYRFTTIFLAWIETNRHKDYSELTLEDLQEYRTYCQEHYLQNGNVGRLSAVNNFTVKFLKKQELRIPVPSSKHVNKPVLSKEELQRYLNAAETSLEKLVSRYQIDGHLRNEDFCRLRISGHDCENQILYTDDSKSGDMAIALTPFMEKAFKEYLLHRVKPKRKEDEDKLIIVPKGSHYGLSPSLDSDFIYRLTKTIAARAGFNRSVYPYLIKPSAITNKFNEGVPAGIIMIQSRHRNIETTHRYDHTKLKDSREYFNKKQGKNIDANKVLDLTNIKSDDKARLWMEKYLANEIDINTFISGMDVLLPDRIKHKLEGDNRGYG
jgi:site-specific recombinase XerD